MKTWIKRTLIGIVGAGVLFGGFAACSHHHRGGLAGWSDADVAKLSERMVDKAGRKLDLNEAQKAKLSALALALQAQRTALIANPAGQASPRADLQALFAKPEFDRAKAQALIEAKTGAVRDKSPAVVAAMGDFFDSLKPEQQQKLRELMAHRGSHHGWRG